MDRIKFGTDGWRAIIAKDFTILNVSKVAYATAQWLTKKYKSPSAVVGYDCRFGGEMFMEAVAKILASKGIRVYIPEHFVSTPMVSLGVLKLKAKCGIIITASHKGAEYNGFKIRAEHGGALPEKDVRDIEYMINDSYEIDLDLLNWNYMLEQGLIQYIDLETIYIKQIKDSFDIEKMAASGKRLAFDAMYGSGQNVIKKLFPDSKLFHCEVNPTFMGIPPEPIHKNLHELSEYIWCSKEIDCGIATDGDGDRLALYDHEGNLIDAHHVMLLLIHYLAGYKKLNGEVVASFSLTSKIEKICKHYSLDAERVKIGFSEITGIMISGNVLLGGEESGGIATGAHLPERDGIWSGLMIWQWMIETGKTLKQLIQEVYDITGPFACGRQDIELNKNIRNKVIGKCSDGSFTSFGEFVVNRVEHIDGYKFYFTENQWLLIRLSGTEPLLRLYSEAEDNNTASSILDAASVMIQNL
jgi:phosphomannomutase